MYDYLDNLGNSYSFDKKKIRIEATYRSFPAAIYDNKY